MDCNLKNILGGLLALGILFCSSPPPPTDQYQRSLDESDRILEQHEKQNKKTIELFDKTLTNLRKESSDLKKYKKFLANNWQKYKQDEAGFLIQLNQLQLEFYSEWFDSLQEDNQPKQMLCTKKLTNSLNVKQNAQLSNPYIKWLEHISWVTDFQKKNNEFQNKKNDLLQFLKLTLDDPNMYEIMKLSIENELSY